jgi:hypothetical protein
MTILALVCFLVAGAAAASILGRDTVIVSAARFETPAKVTQSPLANRESKKDKLPLAMAALPPADDAQRLPEQLRQAFASDSPFGPQPPKIAAPATTPPQPVDKPKAATKAPVQKSYALLSDVQIAGIKERLKLSPSQEQHWPGVESALRAIARKIHATRQSNPQAAGAPVDPDWAEVQQLKSVAMPLLFQLREDQKREVRQLAHIIGLGAVASLI